MSTGKPKYASPKVLPIDQFTLPEIRKTRETEEYWINIKGQDKDSARASVKAHMEKNAKYLERARRSAQDSRDFDEACPGFRCGCGVSVLCFGGWAMCTGCFVVAPCSGGMCTMMGGRKKKRKTRKRKRRSMCARLTNKACKSKRYKKRCKTTRRKKRGSKGRKSHCRTRKNRFAKRPNRKRRRTKRKKRR